jgi:anionic cell wall polymer biosynthesis LytR-Cps2A-Psr (LCP) family protein
VQVAGTDGTAKASALVGVRTDEKRAAAVLIPSRLIVDLPGSGSVAFGEALGLPDKEAPAKALTDLLGVSVDGGWVLTQAGLAALVDKVGGVPAEVDVDVVTKAADGSDTVVVRAGSQHLAGPAAAAYATYAAAEEPEQARLARFSDVLDGVLRGLPDQTREIEGMVASLKAGSSSTLSASLLAEILAAAHAVSADGDMLSDVLPVNAIATGAGEESYGVNAQQAAALMEARFAPSLVKDTAGGPVRVLVQNGVGTPGLVDKARTKLVKAGFRFVNGNNAPEFGQKQSAVLIPDSTPASVERGAGVAAALGLPASSVGVSGQGQTVAEVIVVLGKDFKP